MTALPQNDDDPVTRALEDALAERAYQLELPPPQIGTPPPRLGWLEPLGWIAVVLVVAALIVGLVWFVAAQRRRGLIGDVREGDGTDGAPSISGRRLAVDLDAVHRLAAEGRFDAALHLLLELTLSTLVELAGIDLAASWTSREVVARIPLAPRARAALSDLVLAVELSHFGGRPVGEADLAEGLRRFELFRAELAGDAR